MYGKIKNHLLTELKNIREAGLYKNERIIKKAKDFEALRDDAKLHASAFGIAVIFLQISILLSSISALSQRKYVWFLSLAVGVVGITYFLDGFFLFF